MLRITSNRCGGRNGSIYVHAVLRLLTVQLNTNTSKSFLLPVFDKFFYDLLEILRPAMD